MRALAAFLVFVGLTAGLVVFVATHSGHGVPPSAVAAKKCQKRKPTRKRLWGESCVHGRIKPGMRTVGVRG